MATLSDSFAPTGGVSQEPPRLREEERVSAQENALSNPFLGLTKRPPLDYQSVIPATVQTAMENGEVTVFEDTDGSRYWIALTDGAINIVDYDTGLAVTVNDFSGTYLDGAGADFETFQFQNELYISNRAVSVQRTDDTAPVPVPQAIVAIRSVDFGTKYSLTLNGATVSYTTPVANSPEDRLDLGTPAVAAELKAKLESRYPSAFTITQYGSTLHIQRADGADFTLVGEDGLADRGMVVVKESVQRFEDLPLRCKDGFICKVTGDPGIDEDDYWVKFVQAGGEEDQGTWEETPQPGSYTALDPDTMPHVLRYKPLELDGLTAESAAPAPELGTLEGVTEEFDVGEWLPNSGAAIVSEHNDFWSLTTSLTDLAGTFTIPFFIDTTLLPQGEFATIEILVDGSQEAAASYGRGVIGQRTLTTGAVTLGASGSEVRIRISYSGGVTPQAGSRATVRPSDFSGNAGFFESSDQEAFTLQPGAFYPEGWALEVTLNGTDVFTYTVSSGVETGEEVAEGIKDLIDADSGWTATRSNTRVTMLDTSSQPASSISFSVTFDNTTTAFVPGATFDESPVGKTLVNQTTGAEGTITDQSGVVLTFSLSGGTRTTVLGGDLLGIREAGEYFTLEPEDWETRKAGSTEIVPFPGFTNRPIEHIFSTQGRLGFLSGKYVVLAQAGDRTNWFRQSARVLLDDDPVDIEATGPNAEAFKTVLEWGENIYLVNRNGLFLLRGDPILTPRTVQILFAGSIPNSADVQPVEAGDLAFFLNETPQGLSVLAAQVGRNLRVQASPLNEHVPTYIPVGSRYKMAADADLRLLVISNGTDLFFMRWNRDQTAWAKGAIETTGDSPIYDIEFINSELQVFLSPEETDMVLGGMAFPVIPEDQDLVLDLSWTGDFWFSNVSFTPPIDGLLSQWVCYRTDTREEVTLTNDGSVLLPTGLTPPATEGEAIPLRFGLAPAFDVTLSPIFERHWRTGRVIDRDRLTIQYVEVQMQGSGSVTSIVTPNGGRGPYTRTWDLSSVDYIRIPVRARAGDFTVRLTSSDPEPLSISQVLWEGRLSQRTRRSR